MIANLDLYSAGRYVASIKRIGLPILDRDTEQALFRRLPDRQARDILITANMPMAISFARRWTWSDIPLPDLIGYAAEGVIVAVDKFDPERGHRFSTYAFPWLRQVLNHAVYWYSRTVRVPQAQWQKRAQWIQQEYQSIGSPRGDGDGAAVGDDFAQGIYESHDHVEWRDQRLAVRRLLDMELQGLESRERLILLLRFCWEGGLTLEGVGRLLNLSRERIRQIESAALKKLRDASGCKAAIRMCTAAPRPRGVWVDGAR